MCKKCDANVLIHANDTNILRIMPTYVNTSVGKNESESTTVVSRKRKEKQMNFKDLGVQGITEEDRNYQGSRYAEVRKAVFANPYQKVWGAPDEPSLPQYEVSVKRTYEGILPCGRPDQLKQASIRTVDTFADLRWGKGKGFRKLVHSNGVCLTGIWEITEDNEFSGYFKKGSQGLIIARVSCATTAITRGKLRAFGIAGKLYPTLDENHEELLKPASFLTAEKITGSRALHITDVGMTNAFAVKLLETEDIPTALVGIRAGLVFKKVDVSGTVRQLYQIAELNKEPGEATNTPEFMRLKASEGHLVIDEEDFRDETLAHIFDRGNPTPQRILSFDISVANEGKEEGNPLTGLKVIINNWRKIGTLTFDDGVASYNGDFVLHFNHPAWRLDKNNSTTVVRGDQ